LTRNRLWKDFGAQPGSNEKNEGTKHPKPSGSSWDIKKVHDRKCFGFACNERLEGTAATITLGIANGADIVRVHDVKEMVRVARMTDAMVRV